MNTPPQTMPDEPFVQDEPLFVFRARDELSHTALCGIMFLYTQSGSIEAAKLIDATIKDFEKWREKNATIMPK